MTESKQSLGPPGPVANGTATGYSTGDEMFKAAARPDRPARIAPRHEARDAVKKTQWRRNEEDDAEEFHEPRVDQAADASANDIERTSANEPAERGD